MYIDTDKQTEDRLAQSVKCPVTGEETSLDNHGDSVAKEDTAQHGNKKQRRSGQWKGKVKIAQDFDELPGFFTAFFR